MTSELTARASSAPALPDRTLIHAGAAFAFAAGTLRLPASFTDADASGPAVEALYYAIDISLLFAAITAFVAIPTSRTRLGTIGFAITSIGTGLLIGPEPTDSSVRYYAIGASATIIGFALLAIAWRHGQTVTRMTRRAFLATLAIALVSSIHQAIFVTAGIMFSLALLSLGHDLRRLGSRWGRTGSR